MLGALAQPRANQGRVVGEMLRGLSRAPAPALLQCLRVSPNGTKSRRASRRAPATHRPGGDNNRAPPHSRRPRHREQCAARRSRNDTLSVPRRRSDRRPLHNGGMNHTQPRRRSDRRSSHAETHPRCSARAHRRRARPRSGTPNWLRPKRNRREIAATKAPASPPPAPVRTLPRPRPPPIAQTSAEKLRPSPPPAASLNSGASGVSPRSPLPRPHQPL